MAMSRYERCPTGKELDDRDFGSFKDKVHKLEERDMFVPIGRAFCVACHYENEDRKTAEKSGREYRVDATYKFLAMLNELDVDKAEQSTFLQESTSRKLAESLHTIIEHHLCREKPQNPAVIYHACAYAFGKGHKGDSGYYGLGKRLAQVIQKCDDSRKFRESIFKGLLEE